MISLNQLKVGVAVLWFTAAAVPSVLPLTVVGLLFVLALDIIIEHNCLEL